MGSEAAKKNILPVEVLTKGHTVIFRNRRWAALLIPSIGFIPLAGWFSAGAEFRNFSVLFFVLGVSLVLGGLLMAINAREWRIDRSTRMYSLRSGTVFFRQIRSGDLNDMVISLGNRKSHHYSPASQTHRYRGAGLVWTIDFVTKEGERFLYWEGGDEQHTREEAEKWATVTSCKVRDDTQWIIHEGSIKSRQNPSSIL